MSFYDPIAEFYSRPQVGGSIGIFQGNRKQSGGGIFASIQRFAIPILRRLGEKLLNMAPSLGSKAMEVVKETIGDVRAGKRLGESLKSNVSNKFQKTLNDFATQQQGSGMLKKRRRRRRQQSKRKSKLHTIAKKSINKSKASKKRRVSKRRKIAFRDIFSNHTTQ